VNFIQNTQGSHISLGIVRDGVSMKKTLQPTHASSAEPYTIGIALDEQSTIHLPFAQAIVYSFTTTYDILADIFRGIGHLFASLFGVHSATHAQVSGPVGIIKVIKDAMTYGADYVLYLTALISLNLAVLNILPIPALDGGRLLFILIEKIKGKPININTATIIHSISFMVLVGLMLLVTVFDVVKLFR
jgi:regulator of sigma E protease